MSITSTTGAPALTVNDLSVTPAQFFTVLQSYKPNPNSPAAGQAAGVGVMQQLIQKLTIEGLAKEQNVAPTDAQVEAKYNSDLLQQESQKTQSLADMLADVGMSVEDFKALQIRPELAQDNLIGKGIAITDADIKAYYDLNKAKPMINGGMADNSGFTLPARAHIKQIALSSQTDAQSIYNQIKSGQMFETFVSRSLAAAQSPDGDQPNWVPLENVPNPALAPLIKAVNTTDQGQVSPPFQFQSAWWLIKVVEKKPAKETLTLDQCKDMIRTVLLYKKAQQNPTAVQSLQQQLRDYQSKARVAINLPGKQYQDLIQALKTPPPPMPAPPASAPPVTVPPAAPQGKR